LLAHVFARHLHTILSHEIFAQNSQASAQVEVRKEATKSGRTHRFYANPGFHEASAVLQSFLQLLSS